MSKSEKKDENGMGEPITATHPDPIPPVHVLEAAQDQEKKETEDLLAGFDRPGRGPKKPEGERDFVEYFAKKSGATPTPPPVRAAAAPAVRRPKQADIETVVVPRNKKPGVGTWLLAAAVMLGLGGMIAFFATRDDVKTSSVGSATTITSTSPPPSTRSSHDDIPPPPPASEVSSGPAIDPPSTADTAATNVAPPSSAPKKRDPKGAGSARDNGANATAPTATTPVTSPGAGPAVPSSKPPPRDDLIRGM